MRFYFENSLGDCGYFSEIDNNEIVQYDWDRVKQLI